MASGKEARGDQDSGWSWSFHQRLSYMGPLWYTGLEMGSSVRTGKMSDLMEIYAEFIFRKLPSLIALFVNTENGSGTYNPFRWRTWTLFQYKDASLAYEIPLWRQDCLILKMWILVPVRPHFYFEIPSLVHLFYMIVSMAADVLVTQGARASSAMLLT